MEVSIRLRENESSQDAPLGIWDSTWNDVTNLADWSLAGFSAPGNSGGLQANHALHTAILLCLFTWRRQESYEPSSGSDPRGWWGDTVDLEGFEQPLGSKLYLLQRSTLSDAIAAKAVVYAQEALRPLVLQGAVARIDVTAQTNVVQGALGLTVNAFSRDGQNIYSQTFSRLWRQEFGAR